MGCLELIQRNRFRVPVVVDLVVVPGGDDTGALTKLLKLALPEVAGPALPVLFESAAAIVVGGVS